MQIISILLGDGLKNIIGKLPIFLHLFLHLLSFSIQALKLILKTLEQFPHLSSQTDMILGRVFLFIGQFDTDIVDGYAFFEANALNFTEIEGPALIVGDVMYEGFFDPQIGDLFEVYQQLVCHILQSHTLRNSTILGISYLFKDLLLQFFQTVIAFAPVRDITLSQSEPLSLCFPASKIFDSSDIGAVFFAVHHWKDLNVLYICQLARSLLGQTEQSLKFCLRQQFLLRNAFELYYGQFVENGREFILDVILEILNAFLAFVLEGSEVESGIFALVFFYLVTQVQLFLALYQPCFH